MDILFVHSTKYSSTEQNVLVRETNVLALLAPPAGVIYCVPKQCFQAIQFAVPVPIVPGCVFEEKERQSQMARKSASKAPRDRKKVISLITHWPDFAVGERKDDC